MAGNLNRELGAKPPRKKQINQIKKEVKTVDIGKRIVAIMAVFAILLAAGGYAFMRWQTVSGLRRQVGRMEDELANMRVISSTYDEIYAEYIRYSTAYETNAERRTQDCRALIDKTRELIEPYGYITNITVDGNTLQVTVSSEDISRVTDSLNNDPDKQVVMVVPMTENKEKNAASSGTISTGGQTGTGETGENPQDPDAPPPASDSTVVDEKVLVESTAIFKLIFADREG